jgi:diamine N-acetyltransferase
MIAMNLVVREANTHDFLDISKLTAEVHKLHLSNRPDVYADINDPLVKQHFIELLNDTKAKIFVV